MNDSNIIEKLNNLKSIRESRNITQIKLSTDLGISQEVISRYENGSAFPQPNRLIQLSNYFNCSVDYLLGLTDIITPIKYLQTDSKTLDNADLIIKYNMLSSKDKSHVDSYINFLLNNTSNELSFVLLYFYLTYTFLSFYKFPFSYNKLKLFFITITHKKL